MSIIDEMRREAGNAERSGHTYESLFMAEWADRLAASGALVPVPDGEACELVEIASGQKFVVDGRSICETVNGGQYDSRVKVRNITTMEEFVSYRYGVDVLPIRLVAITEAEV